MVISFAFLALKCFDIFQKRRILYILIVFKVVFCNFFFFFLRHILTWSNSDCERCIFFSNLEFWIKIHLFDVILYGGNQYKQSKSSIRSEMLFYRRRQNDDFSVIVFLYIENDTEIFSVNRRMMRKTKKRETNAYRLEIYAFNYGLSYIKEPFPISNNRDYSATVFSTNNVYNNTYVALKNASVRVCIIPMLTTDN